jgi:hypothetical protein
MPPETRTKKSQTTNTEGSNNDTTTITEGSSTTTTDISGTTVTNSYTFVQYDAKALYPLADYIAIVQMIPQQIRSDLFSWIGTSAWASYWHENHDPDAKQFQWIPLLQQPQSSSSQLLPTTSSHQ